MFRNNQKKKQAILENYKQVKQDHFDFERIALYFSGDDHSEAKQVINHQIMKDLDFEELFTALDRTNSIIGQQYLYAKLRVIPKDLTTLDTREAYIKYIERRAEDKEVAVLELSKLNNPGTYFIQRLFFGKNLEKPGWFWLVPILSGMSMGAVAVGVFFPSIWLIALVIILINSFIHLWNKNNVLTYTNTIPQLLKLHGVAEKLSNRRLFEPMKIPVNDAIRSLKRIRRFAFFFKWESKALDDLTQAFDYLKDLVKAVFLLEPIIFFKMMQQVEQQREAIKTLYTAVGELDMAISIASWRESLPYYCLPAFADGDNKQWRATDMFHPLIEHPVSNDLTLTESKSILLSGSNMSGKTTFVRTLGLNALLAQTLNTACANTCSISRFKIWTAIRITDDLLDDSSYYYKEVKLMKQLIEESDKNDFNLLLLDEIFKGTNTVERIASGKSVLSYLNHEKNLVCCSTHDLELIDYLEGEYDFFHFEETIHEEQLHFDYQLKQGGLNNTNAIRLLEINGFPDQITNEAFHLAKGIMALKKSAKDK